MNLPTSKRYLIGVITAFLPALAGCLEFHAKELDVELERPDTPSEDEDIQEIETGLEIFISESLPARFSEEEVAYYMDNIQALTTLVE